MTAQGKARFHSRGGWAIQLGLAVATFLFAGLAHGSAALWAANCQGCHGASPSGARANAANAAAVITAAINNGAATGMNTPALQALTGAERTSLATYIESVIDTTPVPIAPAFQTALPVSLAGKVVLNTAATALTTLVGTAPGKGSVAYDTVTPGFIYTPAACQTGADSFTYRARNAGDSLSTASRTVNVTIGPPPAPVVNAVATTGQTGVVFSRQLTVTSCASLVTNWAVASGTLPPGLTLNAVTGIISGTPTTIGAFNATVTATNAGGTSAPASVGITVSLGPPVIDSAATVNGAVGIALNYTVTATNGPNTFGTQAPFATLPAGLALNPATGAVTGTPTGPAGNTTVRFTANNGVATDTQDVVFQIAVGVPAITSAPTANGQTGVPFSYQITATNGPPFTAFSATGLPPGLSINTTTGLISGTPTVVGGPTNVTLTASNATGTSAAFILAITVGLGPPVITSPLAAAGGVTVPFNYQITATNPPHTAFNATGLPAGLTVNTGTGAITGAPAPGTAGTHNVTISATNATGTGADVLVLNISQSAPVVNSPATANGQTGVPFTYQITGTNGPTTFAATGLPPGLSVNTATGLVSGTPTTVGVFAGTVTAANGAGSSTQPVTFTITLGPPVITSGAAAGGVEATPFSYQITATNNPTSFGASGLPPGITVNPATGLISGTPGSSGTFNATISATNATATTNAPLVITINVGVPVITSATSVGGSTGAPFSYRIVATNAPTSFAASPLPAGLSFDAATGILSGVPTREGQFTLNIAATNATGTGSAVLRITIALTAPQLVSAPSATGQAGQPFLYQVQATGNPGTFSATGLPPGLSIDASSGLISGVPTSGGTFLAQVTAANGAGSSTFGIQITIGFIVATVADVAVEVPFEEPTAITLPVTGDVSTVNLVTLPDHGIVTTTPGNRLVTYQPATGYSGPDRFVFTITNPAGTSTQATVSIVVGTLRPVASAATLNVPLNTPATVDLARFVKGSGLTGISIVTPAARGTVEVNGTRVTYIPRPDDFAPDAFAYVAFGNAGRSEPATVTVVIDGRPDPTLQRDVAGIADAQAQAARRFAAAQIGNFQRRMETLHRPPAATPPPPAAPAPQAQPERAPRTDVAGLLSPSLVASLMTAATTRSVDLSASREAPQGAGHGTSVWLGGTASFGRRDADGSRSGLDFSTDGISVGADRRLGDRLAVGAGVGFARDETDVGQSGSRSKARGAAIAAYGTYHPARSLFVDALLGYGHLTLDSDRYVAAMDAFASGRRKGRQVFGSVAAGFEQRREGTLFSPYGRLDFSFDRLDAFTESGAEPHALTFREQNLRSAQGALGVRVESEHALENGRVAPRLRLEYRRELERDRRATVAYADLFNGPEYSISAAGTSRNALLLGVGADFLMRGGLRFGVDYQAQRQAGAGNGQALRFMLTQELDARGLPAWSWEPPAFKDPVTIEVGYAWDDNVTRGRESSERRSDRLVTLGFGQPRELFKLGDNARVIGIPILSAEKFRRYQGLGRFSGGAQAELQYRGSGAFDATTYTLLARGLYSKFESDLRTGPAYYLAINARRALTDRIELFGEVGASQRYGRSDVFDQRDWSARVNLDYSLGRNGTLYAGGEYRRGDTVSSGAASLVNLGLADVFVPDDAFDGLDFFAYRFDARMVMGTLGYNRPLGPRDSLDFSWRRVQATPRGRVGFESPGSLRYIDNQYSIVYLMRF